MTCMIKMLGMIPGVIALLLPYGTVSAQQFWKTSWSADGEHIAFGYDSDIWMIDADGVDPVNLTETIDEDCSCPDFLSENQEISFSVLRNPQEGDFAGKVSEILILNIESGEKRVVLHDAYAADISQDGKAAVYIKGWTKYAVYDFDSRKETIYDFNGADPPWFCGGHPNISPDKTFFMTRFDYGRNTTLWDRYKLYRVSIGNGEAVIIPLGEMNYVYPRYSPDGSIFLFSEEGFEEPYRLVTADLSTGVRTVIDAGGDYETKCGSWSPDGSKICYVRNEENRTSLCVYDRIAGAVTVLYSKQTGPIGIDSVPAEILMLRQNYPNPFNPLTTIEFSLHTAGHVHLDVYNCTGQKIRTLYDRYAFPGTYSTQWNGRDDTGAGVSSGLYLYRLDMGEQVRTGHMMLIR